MTKLTLFVFISLSISTILCIYGCKSKPIENENYITIDGFAQGGTYHVVYKKPAKSVNIPDSLTLYFNNINKSVSGYDSLSLITRINNGENLDLDSIFIDIFNSSYKVYKESNGAFDVSAGPFFNLWGFGFKNKEHVSQEKIDSIMQFIGMDKLSIKEGKLIKTDKRMQVNFNAIAQGYTCDYIGNKLTKMGITNYLLEVGGEIYCKGVNALGKEWRVAIDKPLDGNFIPGENVEAILLLSNKGLVTSGNYRKFYIENGVKYSHTINPKTGYPVKHNLLSATVIAENATIADAYATYFMVVGLEKTKEILAATPNMDALLVYGEQNNMKVYSTKGIKTDKNR
ncbi:MAG: FAD:protein FMN transferase [Bacteroidales bacterium]